MIDLFKKLYAKKLKKQKNEKNNEYKYYYTLLYNNDDTVNSKKHETRAIMALVTRLEEPRAKSFFPPSFITISPL